MTVINALRDGLNLVIRSRQNSTISTGDISFVIIFSDNTLRDKKSGGIFFTIDPRSI
jgi:hypothetical protein